MIDFVLNFQVFSNQEKIDLFMILKDAFNSYLR